MPWARPSQTLWAYLELPDVYPLLIAGGVATSIALSMILVPKEPLYFSGPFLGVIVFALVFFLLTRLASKKVGPLFEMAQRHTQAGKVDLAIEAFQAARAYKHWQLFLDKQLNTQIGILNYALGKEDEAAGFLAKGYPKVPQGPLVLGALQYRGGKKDEAVQTLESAIRFNRDSAVLPNFLAWIHEQEGDRDAAIAVLHATSKVVRANEETADNLDRLKNGKRMNMKGFGQNWFMLKFETPQGMGQAAPLRKGFRQPATNKGKALRKQKKGKRR